MRKIVLVISLLIYGICSYGQDWQEWPYEGYGFKYWTEGKLTEEDFQVRKISDLTEVSSDKIPGSLDWTIGFETETVKIGNLRYKYIATKTYMDQIRSWINQDVSSKQALEYFQTEFDIVESFRRKLQNQLNQNPYDYYNVRDYNQRLVSSAIDALRMETAYGYDTIALAKYQNQYEQKLDSWEEVPVTVPRIVDKGIGSSFYFGYNSQIFGSSLSNYFGPSQGLLMGLDFLIRNLRLGFSMAFNGTGPLKEDSFYTDPKYDYQWRKGVNCTSGIMLLDLSYTVLDKPAFSLSPAAGFGVNFIDQRLPADLITNGHNNSEIAAFMVEVGMNFNIKLRRSLSLAYGYYSYSETCLVLKVFEARSMFKEIGPVNSINLGLCIDFGFLASNFL